MSVLGDRLSKSGFPFTPSRFKGIPQAGEASAIGWPEPWRLTGVGVTADHIDERTTQSDSDISPVATRGFGRVKPAAQIGVKLLPLQGFVWGSRAALPQPRTRGEQVLIWVSQGSLQLDFPRARHLLGPDSLHFIPSGTAFASMPFSGCQGRVLLIAPSLTRDLAHAFPDRAMGGRLDHDDQGLAQLMHDLIAEARQGTSLARAAVDCHLGLLALRLTRLEPPAQRILRGQNQTPDRPLAEAFVMLVQNRMGDGSTIADLAEELGTNTAELDAACRHRHGKRAIDLLNHLRLRRAAQMLRDTSDSPARIARALGYCSMAHFSRAFVMATGRLPEQFRNAPR